MGSNNLPASLGEQPTLLLAANPFLTGSAKHATRGTKAFAEACDQHL
jgi:hypothetical protein